MRFNTKYLALSLAAIIVAAVAVTFVQTVIRKDFAIENYETPPESLDADSADAQSQ